MAFDTLSQKYLRPSLIIWSESEPLNSSTPVSISSIVKTDQIGTTSEYQKIQYTTPTDHGFSVNQAVTISGASSAVYNFTTPQIITDVTSTTFKIKPDSAVTGGTTSTATAQNLSKWDLGTSYLYISDNNRSELSVSFERIEYKQRMINGTMRSYHVADKKNFSTSWEKLPSRKTQVTEYSSKVVDKRSNFAGGQEMLKWYEDHTGDFWMLLVYDFDSSMQSTGLRNNVEKVNVFFSDFSYNVVDRGLDLDLWNINLSLVEV
jgi:hypothetical protein